MQNFLRSHTGRGCRVSFWVFAISLPASAIISGCGGGGGINSTSTSAQGFRIVPAGGTVVPLTDAGNAPLVSLLTSANLVAEGVQVSAASTDPPALMPVTSNGQTVLVPGSAYQLSFSPDSQQPNPAVPAVALTLAYSSVPVIPSSPAKPLDLAASFHIYFYDGKQWTVLPFSTTQPASGGTGGTVTATMETVSTADSRVVLTPYLKSGIYAVFAAVPPVPPPTL